MCSGRSMKSFWQNKTGWLDLFSGEQLETCWDQVMLGLNCLKCIIRGILSSWQEGLFRNRASSQFTLCFSPFRLCIFSQDLPNAMNAAEITDKLGLHSLRHRNWYIQATCATSGDGLYEGLDWLANQLKNKK